jgi:hypothetical protein
LSHCTRALIMWIDIHHTSLDRLATTYSLSTPPLAEFSRASALTFFEQPAIRVFHQLPILREGSV